MIYMVEHTFARPDWEADWHAWYQGNVRVLLSVPGIHTAQRFRVPDTTPPRFMALYTVDSGEVFESTAYKNAGGGGTNSQRFRPAYQVWVRNLFEEISQAPEVPMSGCLVVYDREAPDASLAGVAFAWGRSVGLHRTTPWRGLGVTTPEHAARIAGCAGVTVYAPMTVQHGKND